MSKIKVQITMFPYINEKFRDVVYWTPDMTLSEFVSEALLSHIGEYERRRGSEYPSRKSNKTKGQ